MAYVKTQWTDGVAPGINAIRLNNIENGIKDIDNDYLKVALFNINISSTGTLTLGTLPATANLVLAELSLGYYYTDGIIGGVETIYDGATYNLNLGAKATANGHAIVHNPFNTANDRYDVRYYFEVVGGFKYLRVIVPGVFIGYRIKANLYYKGA